MKITIFQLTIDNKFDLVPYLSGNCLELGNWNPESALKLNKESQLVDGKKELWSLEVSVPFQTIEYKYFLGPATKPDGKINVVCFFEQFVRTLNSGQSVEDEFGYREGRYWIEKKCLEDEFEYRLKILKPPSFLSPLLITCQNYIKCEIVFPEISFETGRQCIFVSSLDGQTESSIQPKDGVQCSFSDFITLCVRSTAKNPIFRITFSRTIETDRDDKLVEDLGYAFICLESGKQGLLTASITSPSGFLIGMLSLDVLVIEPLPNFPTKRYFFSQNGLVHDNMPLMIGHRGCGATFRKGQRHPGPLENTLDSFLQAYNSGIKMVEFDVMLSKDKVPIIYHDYQTVLLHNFKGTQKKLLLQVQDISYSDMISNDFQLCKDDCQEMDPSLYGESDQRRLFPRLEDALKLLPEDLGFNVEIKYCMELSTGKRENNVSYTEERNSYLNAILDVCLGHAGSRKIVFSSFDPDVCSMLKVKQCDYPVMFLTQGAGHYEEFLDKRTKSVEKAINFAASESLFGIVAYSGSLLENLPLIKTAKEKGLEVYCWGNENNDLSNIQKLRESSIDGIILDKIELVNNTF